MTEHLSSELIAGYADGTLPRADRTRVEEHVADCFACGEHLITAARAVRLLRGRRRLKVVGGVGAVAAVVAVVLLGPAIAAQFADEEPRLRSPDGRDPLVRVVRPADRSVLPRDSLTFLWRGVSADASYTFTLTDRVGDIVWRVETSDTVLSLDGDVALRAGDRYFWYVDAFFGDGREAESGVHEVTAGDR